MTDSEAIFIGREFLYHAMLLALPALVSGCALNPATGERNFTAFMSLEDERRIRDQEHPNILARFGGAYDDPALTAYVAEIGQAIAAKSEMPELDCRFTILNTPVVNAFALPGGYIYMSRGLLALADSEAELAGVLAHEIGHVTARHAARRYSRHVLANFGAELLDLVTIGGMAEAAQAEADAYIQGYTRDQEFEADSLGLRYLRAAGYDAGAVPRFLNKLAAYRVLEAKLRGLTDAGVSFMAAIHLYSTLDLLLPPELNGPQFLTDMMVAGIDMKGVTVTVPDKPGLGITVPEDKIRAHQLRLA